MAVPGQQYTIHGVRIVFPWKPYPSQFSMMDKIIRGLEKHQNCLLESPTGSGKSLALLCSALAWQRAERERMVNEDEEFSKEDSTGIQCKCKKVDKSDTGEVSSAYFRGETSGPSAEAPTTSRDAGKNQQSIGTESQPMCIDDDEDDSDFKPSNKKFRTPGGQKRSHTSINYEETPPAPQQPSAGDDAMPNWKMEISESDFPCTCGANVVKKKRPVPKIYFGTRTHKQIAQITKELGRTAYKDTRMTILASRENTCIDPEVSSMSNKNEECRSKLDTVGCRFKDRVVGRVTQSNLKLSGYNEAWDLEDLVTFCKKKGISACPYYGTRELMEDADIIFCPYNYLIDPLIRKSMMLNLKGQIVILDEAHNMEDASREAGSVTISSKAMQEAKDDMQKMISYNINPVEHGDMEQMIRNLEGIISNGSNSFQREDFADAHKVWSGSDMRAQLSQARVGPEHIKELLNALKKIASDEEQQKEKRGGEGPEIKLKAATKALLEGVFLALQFMYDNNMKHFDDYRLAVTKSMITVYNNMGGKWVSKRRGGGTKTHIFNLHFWCLNPAVCFELLEECRSVILTSGTLSPMDTFQSELGTPFPIQLEANHVIGKSQVWVGTVAQGPRGGKLLGTYQVSETFQYQDEVGELVLSVCKTVPFGVLVFMPSYKYIDKMVARWRMTSVFEELLGCKKVMIEPRKGGQEDFDGMMKNFYTIIENVESGEEEELTGALFLAVCRGKVSEGMDFTDNNARAVITVGIPFPNFKDVQVELKKAYNNQYSEKRGLLKGGDWYEIQAYRALNQALGRCIRHRNDWGALILVDERFGKNPKRYIKGLSKWVRQRVQHFQTFTQARVSLDRYTRERQENPATNDFSVLSSQSPAAGSTPSAVFKPPYLPGTNTPSTPGTPLGAQHHQQQTTALTPDVASSSASGPTVQDDPKLPPNVGPLFQQAQLKANSEGMPMTVAIQLNNGKSITKVFHPQPKKDQTKQMGNLLPKVEPTQCAQEISIIGGHCTQQLHTQQGKGDEILDFDPPTASTQMPVQCEGLNKHGDFDLVKTPKAKLEFSEGGSGKKPERRASQQKASLRDKLMKYQHKDTCPVIGDKSDNKPAFKFIDISPTGQKENAKPCEGKDKGSRSNSPVLFDSEDENDSNIEAVLNEIQGTVKSNLNDMDLDLSVAKQNETLVVEESPVKGKDDSPPMDLSSFRYTKKKSISKEDNVPKTPGKHPLFRRQSEEKLESVQSLSTQKQPRNRLSISRRKSKDPEDSEAKCDTLIVKKEESVKSVTPQKETEALPPEEDLNVRRSRRKRKRADGVQPNKKVKAKRGVDFLDEIDEPEEILCACCKKRIVKTSELIPIAPDVPPGLMSFLPAESKKTNAYRCLNDASLLCAKHVKTVTGVCDKVPKVNSHYSREDGAVYSVLICRHSAQWVGCQVDLLAPKHHTALQLNQVWLPDHSTQVGQS